MSKISLWNNQRGADYDFTDRIVGENFDMGATGIYVHKYLGPIIGTGDDNTSNITDSDVANELSIQDVLFLENRTRKYDDYVYELRGSYNPSDNDFDLSAFALFLSGDTIFVSFHITNMTNRLGRKLMSGDVMEFPHLRDLTLNDDKDAINRFYVVQDASHSAEGYGPNWYSHIWRVKAKILTDSEEFRDILGHGQDNNESGEMDLRDMISTYNKDLAITDAIVKEAALNVPYDPVFMESSHLWVRECDGEYQSWWKSGDGVPPNGAVLVEQGNSFPETMVDGDFYLRTDFTPDRLFVKDGSKFRKIEDDLRKKWTGANKLLDTFTDNDTITSNDDGSLQNEKQALSKVVKAKTDD